MSAELSALWRRSVGWEITIRIDTQDIDIKDCK